MSFARIAGLLTLGWFLVGSPPSRADEDSPEERRAPTRAESRVVEQIMDLHDEIEELLATLPPHVRDAVRERLAERSVARAAAEAAEAAATGTAGEATATAAGAGGVAIAPAAPAVDTAPAAGTVAPTTCNTLWRFDSDHDGMVAAVDRYWRHLYLWTDRNGDGVAQEAEIASAYERGVKAIAVALDVFERRGEQATRGEIQVGGDAIVLDLAGDGYGGASGSAADDGILMVDAGRLARGDGPALVDETGIPLAGIQRFRRGLRLREPNGAELVLSCP